MGDAYVYVNIIQMQSEIWLRDMLMLSSGGFYLIEKMSKRF